LSKVGEQLKRPPAGGELISVEVKAVVPKPSDGPYLTQSGRN